MTRKGGSGYSLRKALGAIKDSTTVHLAKFNKAYKQLEINIVKATSHVEQPAKEKHMRAVLVALSATRPRHDVAYCLHVLKRRLSKTRNWAVALKTLIVIHRALREMDITFQEEVLNYKMDNPSFLNLSHLKDYSSLDACDYSYWVRVYAEYLEERLHCFHVLKYDLQTEHLRTRDLGTSELFTQLLTLQTLVLRAICCKPEGASAHNSVIHVALYMVSCDSVKVFKAVSDGTLNLVDKFFEMNQSDAHDAVGMYRRTEAQALSLLSFYETCQALNINCSDGLTEIEPPSSSFIQVMEEYLLDAPLDSAVHKDLNSIEGKPEAMLAIEYEKDTEIPKNDSPPSSEEPKPDVEPVKVEAHLAEPLPDLLCLDDPVNEVSELDENAIVPIFDQPACTAATSINGTAGWELALVTAPSSKEIVTSSSKPGTWLDKVTLDRLYDDAVRRTNQTMSYNPWEQAPVPRFMIVPQPAPNPFTSNMMAASHNLQLSAVFQQQQAFILNQQDQQMMMNPPMLQQVAFHIKGT
uniref:putative clathrin assembly protein At5g35200 n=1 Tax=Erigeron canadensis TaxID=72917 RepID=UPI001CB8CA56|nr:putative clathrin assembly protein At5g35200 [Erigeron canadensis]